VVAAARIDDPEVRHRVAAYLADQQTITAHGV
jgi:hypothetical protein